MGLDQLVPNKNKQKHINHLKEVHMVSVSLWCH